MKKGWKIFWVICGLLAGVGVVFCVIGLALGVTTDKIRLQVDRGIGIVMDEDGVGLAEDIRKTYEGVKKIDADVYAGTVEIIPEDVTDVTVETDGISQALGFQADVDGDDLKITTKKNLWRTNHVGTGTVYIYIPQNLVLDDLSIELGIGSLYMENICAARMSVDAGTGEAQVYDIQASEAALQCGVGSVTGSGCISEKLDIEVGVGELDFTAAGNEEDYDYDIDVGVGDVQCGAAEFSGLGAERKIDNGAGRMISIDCGAGSAVISFDGTRHYEWKEEDHHGI